MLQVNQEYGFRAELNLPYAEAVEKVTIALKEEGFGVLSEIDIQATLKNKLDVDFQKYVILGACNPVLANQALKNELEVGLLLPCNVIVYESGEEKSIVSIIDPLVMLSIVAKPALKEIAAEAQERLKRVVSGLAD